MILVQVEVEFFSVVGLQGLLECSWSEVKPFDVVSFDFVARHLEKIFFIQPVGHSGSSTVCTYILQLQQYVCVSGFFLNLHVYILVYIDMFLSNVLVFDNYGI